jgi:hypothetical protein
MAAARAAERVSPADALRFYDEALVADRTHAPALRGRFRLLLRAGEIPGARAALLALVEGAPEDRRAYQTLLEQWGQAPGAATVQARAPRDPARGDAGAAELLVEAERALAGGDHQRAAEAVRRLGERLGGGARPALLSFAALLFETANDTERATALRHDLSENRRANALGLLRAAPLLSPADALVRLVEAAEVLAPSPLSGAVLRWAARVARSLGKTERARGLLERAAGLFGARALLAGERLELAGAPAPGTSVEDAVALMVEAGPEAAMVLAHRWTLAFLAEGRTEEALDLLAQVGARIEGAATPPLALAAERAALAAKEPALAARAWALAGALDASREGISALTRAEILMRAPETQEEALAALRQAAAACADDAAFWLLSWHLRARGRPAEAAEALSAGARSWDRAGAERLAGVLRERASELRLAALPADLVARLPANQLHGDLSDHPAKLVRDLLDPQKEARAIADSFRSASTEGSMLRVYEAAGWLVHAGATREALSWVLDAPPTGGGEHPLAALFLRRLVRATSDPTQRAPILTELLEGNLEPAERNELEFYRAEALELGDRTAEAAAAYRELLGGPMAADADLALRRVLLGMRDGESLEALSRDEHDALMGAGRTQAAARTLVERARVAADLRQDARGARAALRQALEQDPSQRAARLMLFLDTARQGPAAEIVNLLEALAEDMAGEGVSVLFLASLLAEGKGDPRARSSCCATPGAGRGRRAPGALAPSRRRRGEPHAPRRRAGGRPRRARRPRGRRAGRRSAPGHRALRARRRGGGVFRTARQGRRPAAPGAGAGAGPPAGAGAPAPPAAGTRGLRRGGGGAGGGGPSPAQAGPAHARLPDRRRHRRDPPRRSRPRQGPAARGPRARSRERACLRPAARAATGGRRAAGGGRAAGRPRGRRHHRRGRAPAARAHRPPAGSARRSRLGQGRAAGLDRAGPAAPGRPGPPGPAGAGRRRLRGGRRAVHPPGALRTGSGRAGGVLPAHRAAVHQAALRSQDRPRRLRARAAPRSRQRRGAGGAVGPLQPARTSLARPWR